MSPLIKLNVKLLGLFALLSFPLFYFVYKYSNPDFGTVDFYDYYKLYKGMDYKSADSPLNMRLAGSFFVYLLNKTGLVYNTETQIDKMPFDKSIYFNAILFNFICVIVTCVMIFHLLRSQKHNLLLSFVGALAYLLGFGTIFYELMPLADAPAILLFSIVLWYYYKKSHLIVIPLIILIFQREYIFLALGLLTLMDYIKLRERYYLNILIYCIICFFTYVILRKMFFETPRYSHHTNAGFIAESLSTLRFPLFPFLRQTAMTMNIFVIYVGVILYKRIKHITYNKYEFLKSVLLLLQIFVLSFLLALGNNTGRYYYILIPFIILSMMNELKAFNLDENKVQIS